MSLSTHYHVQFTSVDYNSVSMAIAEQLKAKNDSFTPTNYTSPTKNKLVPQRINVMKEKPPQTPSIYNVAHKQQ